MANKVFISGNLTREVEKRETATGKVVAHFTIAVNGYHDTTDFFTVKVWGNQAEHCAKYLKKGSKVLVEGEIHNRSYEDRDGNKRTVTEITANNVEFLSPREEQPAPAPKSKPTLKPVEVDEDIFPF